MHPSKASHSLYTALSGMRLLSILRQSNSSCLTTASQCSGLQSSPSETSQAFFQTSQSKRQRRWDMLRETISSRASRNLGHSEGNSVLCRLDLALFLVVHHAKTLPIWSKDLGRSAKTAVPLDALLSRPRSALTYHSSHCFEISKHGLPQPP